MNTSPPLRSTDLVDGTSMKGPVYPNWYRVLKLAPSPHLTDQDVHVAFLAESAYHHPDDHPPGSRARARAEAYSKLIRQAYEVLRTKESRARYDHLKTRIASEKDQLHNRAKVLAEGWLKRIEAETQSAEEQATSSLAKERLDAFFRTDAQLRSRHPTLPTPTREQVQRFFEAESERRRAQVVRDRAAHRTALELMIRAEFERRAAGMPVDERRVRWQRGRDAFGQVSQNRKKVDAELGQQAWEVALSKFFAELMSHHQHDHRCASPAPSKTAQGSTAPVLSENARPNEKFTPPVPSTRVV
ncbi:hypothetical protein CROQUDRAFT_661026 [Cronartium quercuum f. sp. fusiforme G11]|uniref:J domain-containing protein n=1 Tax=Cronartium quercuum f. sp. fusiforme G11 TaxID=708437 RepID=A0A9P6T9H8_9BASI|nr:hypothetical protein CROQUDRAFT_661026 [Cronartium quercuum f. sp. fusiforme G11]